MRRGFVEIEGVVLALTPYGESDLVVTLLTDQHGKITAFAKGARKSQRRFAGMLDLFAHLRLHISAPVSSQKTLWKLGSVEAINLHWEIRKSLSKYALSAYLSECIAAFAADSDAQAELFHWWVDALAKLCNQINPPAPHEWTQMTVEFLSITGFKPRWDRCAECDQPVHAEKYFFSFERGGITCPNCRKLGAGRWLSRQDVVGRLSVPFGAAVDAFLIHTLGRIPKSYAFKEEVLRGESSNI